jgi:hypothetical protein
MASVAGSGTTATTKQNVKTIITNLLGQYFSSTLNRESNIANIVMAMVQQESSFNYSNQGPVLSVAPGTAVADYWNSQPIQNILTSGSPIQRSLIAQGLQAWGLMQVMGLNFIKGSSKKNGQTEIQISRPDLASTLCVAPGTDLSDLYSGQATASNQVLAGLVMLESKYKYINQTSNGWHYGKSSQYFNSKLAAAIGAYIGLGGYDRGTGMTPTQYVANIMYGQKYILANGSSSMGTSPNAANVASTSSGQVVNVASGNNQVPPGC